MTTDTRDPEAGGDPLEALTSKEKEAVQKLKDLHHEHALIETEFEKELWALKKRYSELYAPLYSKRSEMLTQGDIANENGTTVPQFWLQAMKNHPMLADMIEENDEVVLAYLQDVSSDTFNMDNSEKMGFSLTFTFAENPYFEPLNLIKTYHMELQPNEKDPALVSTEATEIDWKPGKDITKKVVTRKQKNKRTKQVRKLTETVSVPSFFNFFTKHDIPSDAELEQMNEDQIEELEVVMEADYEAGVILKDRLVPKAVVWFTGEAVDSEIEDMDDRDAGDDDDGDDDLDEPEDEDEEEGEDGEVEAKPKTKKRKHRKKADQQGCKQQ